MSIPLLPMLLSGATILAYITHKSLEEQRAKMRTARIEAFRTAAWKLISPKLVAFERPDGPPTPEMYSLISTLAVMYADLGAERDGFELKAKAVDALRTEHGAICKKLTETEIETEAKLAEAKSQITKLKLSLNKLYGIHAEASTTHVEAQLLESPQLNRLLTGDAGERKACVKKLKLSGLRKMLHTALSYIDFYRRVRQLDSHKVITERKTLEEKIELQKTEIEERTQQVDLLKKMFEDHKAQRAAGEAREGNLQKRIDALKAENEDLTKKRLAAFSERGQAIEEAEALRALCRAQHTIVELHFDATEEP